MDSNISYNRFSFTEQFNKAEARRRGVPELEINLDFQDEYAAENLDDPSVYERTSTPDFTSPQPHMSMTIEELNCKTWNDFFYEYFACNLKQPPKKIKLRGAKKTVESRILSGHIMPEKVKVEQSEEITDPIPQPFIDFMHKHYGLVIKRPGKNCWQQVNVKQQKVKLPSQTMPESPTKNDLIPLVSTRNIISQYSSSLPANMNCINHQQPVLQPAPGLENLADSRTFLVEPIRRVSRIPRPLDHVNKPFVTNTRMPNMRKERLSDNGLFRREDILHNIDRHIAIDRHGQVVNLREFLGRIATMQKQRYV